MTEPPETDQPVSHWQLDKRVPVALLIALAVQAGSAIWWAARTDERLTTVERLIVLREDDHERLVKVDTTLTLISERMDRMGQSIRELRDH